MMRTLLLIAALAVLPCGWTSADVLETFDYPVQSDTTGVAGSFRITETGNYTASDGVVASFSEGYAVGAGVATDILNFYANLDVNNSSGHTAGQSVFLGIMDVPGYDFANKGGPFGTFFSTPQDLTGYTGSVDIRLITFHEGADMRIMALDASDNEVFTTTSALTKGSFTNYEFNVNDFVSGDIAGFDETQVVGLGIEFFTVANGAGIVAQMDVHVDNLLLTIPEPTGALAIGGLFLVGMVRRRRN